MLRLTFNSRTEAGSIRDYAGAATATRAFLDLAEKKVAMAVGGNLIWMAGGAAMLVFAGGHFYHGRPALGLMGLCFAGLAALGWRANRQMRLFYEGLHRHAEMMGMEGVRTYLRQHEQTGGPGAN